MILYLNLRVMEDVKSYVCHQSTLRNASVCFAVVLHVMRTSIAVARSPCKTAWTTYKKGSVIEPLCWPVLQYSFPRFKHSKRCFEQTMKSMIFGEMRFRFTCRKRRLPMAWRVYDSTSITILIECPYHTVLCNFKKLRYEDANEAISRNPPRQTVPKEIPHLICPHWTIWLESFRLSLGMTTYTTAQAWKQSGTICKRRSNEFWLKCTRRYVNWSQTQPASTGR